MRFYYPCKVGGILFFTGLILQIISWHLTYPIHMSNLNALTFSQFYPTIWIGIILSLIGLFLIGHYTIKKSIKAICASIFPIILYSYVYFFLYVPTSDSGGVKAMFQVFQKVGINSAVESYFQYPIYFTLNEITSQILNLDVYTISTFYFAFYGMLLGLFLLLIFYKIVKQRTNQIVFIALLLYFIGIFTYLNYQWVPQTLALIFFLLMFILIDYAEFQYELLSVIVFAAMIFTHPFFPAIFLGYLGVYSLHNENCRNIFLVISCMYIAVLLYHATFFLPKLIDAFEKSLYGLGGEYNTKFSSSFKVPTGLSDNIISIMNRIRIPLTWLVVSSGFLFLLLKKRLDTKAIILSVTGGVYFGVGLFYSILGTRSLQILFIPMVIGFGFYIIRWKKPSTILIIALLILAIFGPIRSVYDPYQFQLKEDEFSCNFLVTNIPSNHSSHLAISGTNFGYFKVQSRYVNMNDSNVSSVNLMGPLDYGFYDVFNKSMIENSYIIYNANLGKEIISNRLNAEKVNSIREDVLSNNKIYGSGNTFIALGLKKIR